MKKVIIFLCAPFLYSIFICPSSQGAATPDTQRYKGSLVQEGCHGNLAGKTGDIIAKSPAQISEETAGDASLGGGGVSDARNMQPTKAPRDSSSLGGGSVSDTVNRQTTPVSPTVGDTINRQRNVRIKVARPKPEIITVTPEQEKKIEDTGVIQSE